MSSLYSGVIGAPVTPFNSNGTVDYDTFAKQINFLIETGVRLITHPMSIGEAGSLTDAERKELAKVLAATTGRRVPTFVPVSQAGTDLAIALAEHAVKAGNTGVILSPPALSQATPRAIIEHYTAVADACGGELIVLNPATTDGAGLGMEVLDKLIDRIPRLMAVIDATGRTESLIDTSELVARKNKPVAVFADNELLLTSMPVGARGCISVCSEVAPLLTQSLYQSCATGAFARAQPIQFKLRRLLKVLTHNFPANVKYAMELLDRPVGAARRPVMAPTAEEKKWIKSELTALEIFDNEPQGWTIKRKTARQAA